jgi:hypothetical protein
MSDDLVERLRDRSYSFKAADPLADEAAAEIERLQAENAFHRKVLATINAVHAFREAMPPPPLLTDAERAAAAFFSRIDGPGNVPVANHHAATLRGLLERTASANLRNNA